MLEIVTTARYERWIKGIRDKQGAARIVARLTRIRDTGNLGDVKPVGDGVSEIRIDCGPGYRVYFGRDGHTIIVLLCGGDKKTQDADIAIAQKLWKEYGKEKQP